MKRRDDVSHGACGKPLSFLKFAFCRDEGRRKGRSEFRRQNIGAVIARKIADLEENRRGRIVKKNPVMDSLRVSHFAAALVLLYYPAVVHADPGTASAGEAGTSEAPAPGEIVVTAQKRAQKLNDIGITINAFTGDTLAKSNVTTATQLVKVTPALGLSGNNAGQILSFSIRGVTQQDVSAQAEGPVAVYVDDGYLALNNIAGLGFYDLDHVEVLKGPQGTLFGRNATGGLVNIVTAKPRDTADGYVMASFGSYGTAHLEGAVGGPIAPGLDFRIAGQVERNDAYIRNLSPNGEDLGGAHDYSVRAHLLWRPSAAAQLLLTAYRSELRTSWAPYYIISTRAVTDGAGVVQNDVEVPGPTGAGTPITPGGSRQVYANYAKDSGGLNRLTGGTAKLTWDIGPELTILSDYKQAINNNAIDDDGAASILNTLTFARVNNFSQEARLFGKEQGWRWYAGVYYLNILARIDPLENQLPSSGIVIDDFTRERTNSYSGFGQVEIDLMPKLTLIGGVRVTREIKDFHYHSELFASDLTGVKLADLGAARTPYDGRQRSTLVNAKASLQYKPTPDTLFYASWSRGAKAGNFTAPFAGSTAYPDALLSYKPETLNAYEVGTKLSMLDRMFDLDAAAFYYDYKNYQSFQLIDISTLVVNRPATTYGGEANATLHVTHAFMLNGSVSYTHNRVKDVPVSGVTRDRTAPFTPKWQLQMGATYEFPFIGGSLQAYAGGHYTSSEYFSISNYSAAFVRSYWTADARVTWSDAAGMWKVSVFGDNLGQAHYRTVGFDLTGLCGCTQVAYGRPRWIGGSITRKF